MYNDILYFNFCLLGLIVFFFLFYLWLCRVGTTSTLHLLLIKKFFIIISINDNTIKSVRQPNISQKCFKTVSLAISLRFFVSVM